MELETSTIVFRLKSNFLMLLNGVSMKRVISTEAKQIAQSSLRFIIDDGV